MTLQETLRAQFGGIDIYWFDQLARGRVQADHVVLDAGCGRGRNVHWLVGAGANVVAIDQREEDVAHVRAQHPTLAADRVRQGVVEALPYEDGMFDVVLANAVLHFARDHSHFDQMVAELSRVLRPGGLLFARLASDIGIEDRVAPLGGGRYRLPDGTDRYLVNEARLTEWTERMGGRLLDPLKTTNVQGLRCMTTWVVRLQDGS